MLAPIIERTMLALDDHYYDLKDANKPTTVVETMIERCQQLTYNWHRRFDCPYCDGVINVLTRRGRVSEHTEGCQHA